MQLSSKILLGMVLGIMLGLVLNALGGADPAQTPLIAWFVDNIFDVIGKIFVISLKLLVVPLVFFSLVCGSASMGEDVKMGQVALKTIALYLVTTAIAVSLALTIANIVDPGVGINTAEAANYVAKAAPSFKDVFIGIFPSNPFQAMVEGNMLQVIVFAILVGVAILQAGDSGKTVLRGCQMISDVIMRMVAILMNLAPYGVFCLLAKLFTSQGFSAIINLALYFGTIVFVLFLHASVVYTSIFSLLTQLNPLTLFKNMRPALLFAFSTSSSNATMPITLNVARTRVGAHNSIASFTIPLGATVNMDGTAIMQGIATVFIAQAYGLDLAMSEYLAVVATATLASIGTAGVPGVGLITLAMVLQQVGLPVEGIGLIIGVDRLLDMMRTVVNVSGDGMVTAVVADSEGLLDRDMFNDLSDQDDHQKANAS
ncbi:MAG: dicarboxylate/amino acid:cation symporter [Porticoccaceae bacterium]|jgi:Na+/H+-dicarboxylate symporter|nr:dicarboxylate/amino acid:cation symporter [Porticoccaceae bacterium]MBT3799294.1 dicarboxylate/amino acid:cation symporter [Porticoccaceae bacterium]MBT4163585.1 dicarboxylate/amino acid:cation symporter [Porticoccaceae bacterium]MBT4211311.1 dicarboxylate/amino acid:cation symporter [Porticoccaceae bacterium]MBT5104516.1 dicarboxylate/amino acid:cation symporter [Porticoccaceae bacterium]